MASQHTSVGKLPTVCPPYPILNLSAQAARGIPVQFSNANGGQIKVPMPLEPQLPSSSGAGIPLQISTGPVNVTHKMTLTTPQAPRQIPVHLANVRSQNNPPNPILLQMIGAQNPMDKQPDRSVEPDRPNQSLRLAPRQDHANGSALQHKPQDSIVSNALQFSGAQFQIRPQHHSGVFYIQTAGYKAPCSAESVVSSMAPTSSAPAIILRKQTGGLQFIQSVLNKPTNTSKAICATKCMPIAPKAPLVIQKSAKTNMISKNTGSFPEYMKKPGAVQDNQSVYVPSNQLTTPNPSKIIFQKLSNEKIVFPVNSNTNQKAPPKSHYNFQIANGQIQNDTHNAVTVLESLSSIPPLQPISKNLPLPNINIVTTTTAPTPQPQAEFSNDNSRTSSIPGTIVEPISEKEYTISIPETDVTMNDDAYTVSISDGTAVNSSIEKSFTIPIPEKGKSLICKSGHGLESSMSQEVDNSNNTIPAILRRSNSENIEKKTIIARRRISLCGETDVMNTKCDISKNNAIPEESSTEITKMPQNRVPSLFCDEELDSEIDAKSILSRELPASLEIVAKNNVTITAQCITKDRRKSRVSSDIHNTNKGITDKNIESNFFKTERKKPNSFNKQPKDKPIMDDVLEETPGLHWNNGLLHLDGSKLQFEVNEFGLIDLADSNSRRSNKPSDNVGREKKSASPDDLYRCDECGCHGLAAEFVTPNFCSTSCRLQYDKYTKAKKEKMLDRFKKKTKPKKPPINKKTAKEQVSILAKKELTNSEPPVPKLLVFDNFKSSMIEEKNINPNPWICSKSGFSWMKYLDYCKATAAPEKFFKESTVQKNCFKKGMKLEAIDPMRPSLLTVVTVVCIQGHRLRLHFDGYDENFDFWVNMDSYDIFPAGWCEKNKHTLRPPKDHDQNTFSWSNYLKQSKAIAAPKSLFLHITDSISSSTGFKIGMKLEAEDKKNSLTCVASIADVINNRILIHFDSWDDIYDYWVDPSSPYIHPVGWCDENGYSLTPPNSYKDPENFTWEEYLAKTKSICAPSRAFKPRSPHKFKAGMKIEAVDKRVPFLVRVATISDVRCFQVKISFDGWPDELSYWVDDDSPDIHPVGWCLKTGHSLEPPLTAEDLQIVGNCGTAGCRGLGNLFGAKDNTHWSAAECPYKLPATSPLLRDRLEGIRPPAKHSEPRPREPRKLSAYSATKQKETVPCPIKGDSRFDKIKNELTIVLKSEESSPGQEDLDQNSDMINTRLSSILRESPKRKRAEEDRIEIIALDNDYKSEAKRKRQISPLITRKKIERSVYEPGYLPNPNKIKPPFWGGDCLLLKEILQNESFRVDPRNWSENDVQRFVQQVTKSQDYLLVFSKHRIDGESFLMLAQDDLVNMLKIKLGPAMKIYNSIIYLREKILS